MRATDERIHDLARRAEAALELAGERLLVSASGADLDEAFEALRRASARERVRDALGLDVGFRLEDAALASAAGDLDVAATEQWLARRLPGVPIAVLRREGPITIAAALSARTGRAPARERYARAEGGRLRVEAFELHVTEHCNLRCANCCNMSPLVAERTLSVDDVARMCRRMSEVLVADVFKIMGGEPLLHPDVAGVLRAVRASGIGDRVRLFTNGLLLHAMKDDFWEALDELTISSYASAPVKPATLAAAKARAKRHGFVLNVKEVVEFSQVLSPRFQRDEAAVAETYARCWLRHRCLVVRGGRFFMCTRAAYADDFLARVAHEPAPAPLDRSEDGVDVDAPDLAERLEAYMNRTEPLGACRYCFGGDGATEPHYQLTKKEVATGLLSRRLDVVR